MKDKICSLVWTGSLPGESVGRVTREFSETKGLTQGELAGPQSDAVTGDQQKCGQREGLLYVF